MTYSSSALPPPAVFLHQETLHAISLPPLASWLISLRKPEHLIRLHDLLERYKTPQSYHRVDVRQVESSELPPGSPESHTSVDHAEDGETDRKRGGSREIVELGEGQNLDTYWLTSNGNANTEDSTQQEDENIDKQTEGSTNTREPGGKDGIEPSQQESSTANVIPIDAQSQIPTTSQTEAALNNVQISPLPQTLPSNLLADADTDVTINQSPPTPKHPLPPIGPTRKVRELRLDLRTLDPAALFALETWRREEMGLEKLNMEFPDSVWYKDATPTPSPSPSPPPVQFTQKPKYTPTGNKRGRPPKGQSRVDPIIVDIDEEEQNISGLGLNLNTGEVAAEDQVGIITGDQLKEHDNLVDAMKYEDGDNAEDDRNHGVDAPTLPVPNILESLGELARKSLVDDMENAQPLPLENIPTSEQERPGPVEAIIEGGETQPVEPGAEAGPSRLTPLAAHEPIDTPSPDVLLDDIFNEKDDDDPDFVPPPSPPARRTTRLRRSRKSNPISTSQNVNEQVEVSMVPSDPKTTQISTLSNGQKGNTSIALRVSVSPEAEPSITNPEISTDMIPSIPQDSSNDPDNAQPVNMTNNPVKNDSTPEIAVFSPSQPEPEPLRQNKRSRRSYPNPSSVPEENPKSHEKARISNASASPSKSNPNTQTKTKKNAKAKFVIEIPTKKVVEKDSDDDEEAEEWGFLKGFG